MNIIKYILFTSIIYQLLDTYKFDKNSKLKIIAITSIIFYYYNLAQENNENVFEKKTNLEDLFKKIDKDITITKVSSVTPSDISTVEKDNKDCSIEIKKLKDSILSLENKLKGSDNSSKDNNKLKSNNNSSKGDNKSKDSKDTSFKRKKSKKNFTVNSNNMTKKNNDNERKANNIKYMDMLFSKLKKEGLLTDDDIEKMRRKLNAGVDDVGSIIMKLEKLNNNSMKYSVKDDEYYKSLGSGISKKWSDKYTILDTKNWAVPAYKPPVCVTNMRCKVCPDNTSGYPVNLMEWDESTKVSNTSINKKWANSQDTETNSD